MPVLKICRQREDIHAPSGGHDADHTQTVSIFLILLCHPLLTRFLPANHKVSLQTCPLPFPSHTNTCRQASTLHRYFPNNRTNCRKIRKNQRTANYYLYPLRDPPTNQHDQSFVVPIHTTHPMLCHRILPTFPRNKMIELNELNELIKTKVTKVIV